MKSYIKIIVLATTVALVGFKIIESEISTASGAENIEITNNMEVYAEKMSPVEFNNLGEMTASWYGPGFHGRLTANGEVYDEMAMTAAHKSMEFGALLRVTNIDNGKSVLVRINDRGPYIPGRQLDLSKGAAIALEAWHQGVINLEVEKVSINSAKTPVVALN